MKGGSDGPEDVDAAFAQIVADLEREGLGSTVQADLDREADLDIEVAPEVESPEPKPGPISKSQPDLELDDEPEPDKPARSRRSEPLDEPDLPEISAPATAGWRGHETEMDWAWSSDDDHYVPPEPPPIPRPSPLTILALMLLLIALFLLVAPGLIGLATRVATPIALVSLTVGIGLVVLRIRQGNNEDDGDNGAQV
ncbi:procyclic acidic repetitive family protein [Kibdelosporangium philippinense]|uniref:Procyclic acidic repetitive family protein n=1 Tax=Kibdelosporangium philippinense TaxID=211113 RepID=A0ABS8ZXR5_9PSEU|nr:procyclic acidic repetitive family protein [Kibdelosporangium philippinense]MCE7011995.1 procyclic acidic repetitive family protein [Kibdelosporangium philippinense]